MEQEDVWIWRKMQQSQIRQEGIIDPVKVTKNALANAVSISATLLTTEAAVDDIKDDKPVAAANNVDMGY